jgi:hypothetical protein
MTVVLAYQSSFEVPIPNSVAQNPVLGSDQFNNPPTRQPRFSAGAMFATGLCLVLTPPSVVQPPVYEGYEVQPVQPPHPTPEKRAAATMRGDDGTQAALINWINTGAEVRPPQPPHPQPEKSGALATGDSGIYAPFTFVVGMLLPHWWEHQLTQPPHPAPEKRAAALMRGDDGIQAKLINWFNTGWEVQPWQPPHWAPEWKSATFLRGDDGIQAQLINWFNTGWEVQPPPPPHRAPEWKAAALMRGDDGNQQPLLRWFNAGWEIQPPQPPHRAPEWRAASLFRGDDGHMLPFLVPAPRGWEIASFQPPHPNRERAGALMLGDGGITARYQFVVPTVFYGFEPHSNVFYKRPIVAGLFAGPANVEARFVPPLPPPPPPPPPVSSPQQFGAKVFAVNCAQGNTNIPVSAQTNVFNPLVVGNYVTLMVSSGNYLLPDTPGQTLIITRPDGSFFSLVFPAAFIGTLDVITDIGTFFCGTYLLSTVFLDQPGFWTVQIVKTPISTQVASFRVDPY